MSRENKAAVGAVLLVAGGIIGAGLALLFAPQAGEKTRRQISLCARKVRNQAEEQFRDAADTVTKAVEELAEKTSALMEQGGEVGENWRRHLLDAIEKGEKELEKQRKKLSGRRD